MKGVDITFFDIEEGFEECFLTSDSEEFTPEIWDTTRAVIHEKQRKEPRATAKEKSKAQRDKKGNTLS